MCVLRTVLYWLSSVTPKAHRVVLRGFPSYEDNLLAVYQLLEAHNGLQIIWIVQDVTISPPVPVSDNTKLVRQGGLLDVFYCLTSRYLFITHGYFLSRTPTHQVCVNLWHGIPFKSIGIAQGGTGRSDTFITATSPLTRKVFAETFGMSENQVIVTGQARTDRLLNASKDDVWRRIDAKAKKPDHLFLWLPTFRVAPHLGNQQDGEVFENSYNCTDFDEEAFNSFLKRNNAICILKPHPMAMRQTTQDYSNIIFVNENWLLTRGISLYELAGAADCLVSDISSIIADFMLLDRPIALLFEDIDVYQASRGFSFNPITQYLPAPVSRDFVSFLGEMQKIVKGEDAYATQRKALKDLFFTHQDNQSTQRILDEVSNYKQL